MWRRWGEQFAASTTVKGPERAADRRHEDSLQTLRFASDRLAWNETQNRIGRDVAVSFANYAAFALPLPVNPVLLNCLANTSRVALNDADLVAGLDAFDLGRVQGFLGEHDAFMRDCYPS